MTHVRCSCQRGVRWWALLVLDFRKKFSSLKEAKAFKDQWSRFTEGYADDRMPGKCTSIEERVGVLQKDQSQELTVEYWNLPYGWIALSLHPEYALFVKMRQFYKVATFKIIESYCISQSQFEGRQKKKTTWFYDKCCHSPTLFCPLCPDQFPMTDFVTCQGSGYLARQVVLLSGDRKLGRKS